MREQDRRLQPVGILVFVDQHMIESSADLPAQRRLGDHVRPIEQQVVVVERVLRLLLGGVRGEQLR